MVFSSFGGPFDVSADHCCGGDPERGSGGPVLWPRGARISGFLEVLAALAAVGSRMRLPVLSVELRRGSLEAERGRDGP